MVTKLQSSFGLMSLTCREGFGCSVGGQSTADQRTDKKKQLKPFVCACVCHGGGRVSEGGCRVRVQPIMVDCTKNMSLLRNG